MMHRIDPEQTEYTNNDIVNILNDVLHSINGLNRRMDGIKKIEETDKIMNYIFNFAFINLCMILIFHIWYF